MTDDLVTKTKNDLKDKSVEEKLNILKEVHWEIVQKQNKSLLNKEVANWFLKHFSEELKEIKEFKDARRETITKTT